MTALGRFTNRDALTLALFPQGAESLVDVCSRAGNMAWHGPARAILWARNGFYIGAAIAAISLIGSAFAPAALPQFLYQGAMVLGVGLSTISVGVLFKYTRLIQSWLNQGLKP